MKKYSVNIDQVWSANVQVSAKSSAEAKKKAWSKFTRKLAKKYYNIIIVGELKL